MKKRSTNKHSITVNNKRYEYTLSSPFKEFGEEVIHVTCKAAGIDQAFLIKDIPSLLIDLPHLIIAEKKHQKKQNEMIRFRVSLEEKKKIEQNALKKGFMSVSSFLRERALNL